MNEKIYNTIGVNYTINRTADHRILASIVELLNLPLGSLIADVGAGTGNYSNALADLGYRIKAVEPSEEMQRQAIPNSNVEWYWGSAESIPLSNNSVDGVIVVLAIHHFSSVQIAAKEIRRICPNGPIVVLTFDPREGEEPWFKNYFPEVYQKDFISFLPINEVADVIAEEDQWEKTIRKFPLPHDLLDRNMYSGWNRPEIYLNHRFRQNVSGLALASQNIVQKGLEGLRNDLETGKWDKEYGYLRNQISFDAGFRFIKCIKSKLGDLLNDYQDTLRENRTFEHPYHIRSRRTVGHASRKGRPGPWNPT
jgi:ubiquinone/menaquinone biosynthesis C-methylase UbiE